MIGTDNVCNKEGTANCPWTIASGYAYDYAIYLRKSEPVYYDSCQAVVDAKKASGMYLLSGGSSVSRLRWCAAFVGCMHHFRRSHTGNVSCWAEPTESSPPLRSSLCLRRVHCVCLLGNAPGATTTTTNYHFTVNNNHNHNRCTATTMALAKDGRLPSTSPPRITMSCTTPTSTSGRATPRHACAVSRFLVEQCAEKRHLAGVSTSVLSDAYCWALPVLCAACLPPIGQMGGATAHHATPFLADYKNKCARCR
jgi:hypothetical protein